MNELFTNPMARVPSNSFSMNNRVALSCNMGYLIPINLIECIPGDKINSSTSIMARLAPLISPMMEHVDVDIHSFFCPTRLVWDNWEKFIVTGVPDAETPAFPYFANFQSVNRSIWDYLGLPSAPLTGVEIDKCSAVPVAVYRKIWNDYYRDEQLQPELDYKLEDGLNAHVLYEDIQKRAWERDYFTSCLPEAQKGDPVNIPVMGINSNIPVVVTNGGANQLVGTVDGTSLANGSNNYSVVGDGVSRYGTTSALTGAGAKQTFFNPNGDLVVDTDTLNANAGTINDLRWAIKLQEFLERDSRGGTRYIEKVFAHFGVRSSDARLNRSEFLAGSRTPIVISEVLQTGETNDTPQGNMAGHGLGFGSSGHVNYFCEEHGYFMTLMSIKPRTSYMQGIDRHWNKFDPLQYAWPTFANMGEQAVLNRELYYDFALSDNDLTFGYMPRYSEYKFQSSKVAGDFKDSLLFWTMGRKFSSRPNLNASFIEADPTHRVFAVEDPDVDKVYIHANHKTTMRRRLPKYGIPSI